jgi:hypothetical protein
MRQLLRCAAGLALLMGCADPEGLPTEPGTGSHAQDPSFARADVERTNVGVIITEPGNPLLVMTGFAAGVTLADLCSRPQALSPNSIAHVVHPPAGQILAASHGQDVPVLVYEFEGDFCDGVRERLLASGTGRFHFSEKHRRDGTLITNFGERGTLDLEAGGQALLAVKSPFYQLPDGAVKFDKTSITLTPL